MSNLFQKIGEVVLAAIIFMNMFPKDNREVNLPNNLINPHNIIHLLYTEPRRDLPSCLTKYSNKTQLREEYET